MLICDVHCRLQKHGIDGFRFPSHGNFEEKPGMPLTTTLQIHIMDGHTRAADIEIRVKFLNEGIFKFIPSCGIGEFES